MHENGLWTLSRLSKRGVLMVMVMVMMLLCVLFVAQDGHKQFHPQHTHQKNISFKTNLECAAHKPSEMMNFIACLHHTPAVPFLLPSCCFQQSNFTTWNSKRWRALMVRFGRCMHGQYEVIVDMNIIHRKANPRLVSCIWKWRWIRILSTQILHMVTCQVLILWYSYWTC